MGKKFLSLGTVFAVLGFLPAAAQANHIDHAASSIACVLVGDQPTLQTRTAYRQFSDSEKPVRYDVHVDGQTPISGAVLEWSGLDYDQLVSLPAVPGPHSIIYYASWAGWQFHDQLSATVYCPSPPPPTAPPAPLTAPVPTPPLTSTPPAPPIKPPHHAEAHCPTVHLILPTARHGVVDFGGRCSQGKIVDTTMYVTAIGQGRRIVCGTAKLHAKGPIIHGVWLYDQTIFCHREAWGSYSLIFVFHVRYRGHVYRCVKRAHFTDHDPGGLPDES